MKLSIGFLTGRREPRLHWVIDDLAAQAEPGDEIQLVVIDAIEHVRELAWPVIDECVRDSLARAPMVELAIAPVRPNIWQGRHRVTRDDWWSTAASRNTFLCLAEHDYIAFLDDCCHLGPRWLETVRQGERDRAYAVAGSFERTRGAQVIDHRRVAYPDGLPNCGGGWLYGCTLCLPLAWALEVNGFEEGCDGCAGEDYMFGLMLANRGRRIDFSTSLHVIQDRPLGDESCVPRFRKMNKGGGGGVEAKNHVAITRFGSRDRTELTPDLTELRQILRSGGTFPIPDPALDWRDWYDDELVREMT